MAIQFLNTVATIIKEYGGKAMKAVVFHDIGDIRLRMFLFLPLKKIPMLWSE